MSQVQSQRQHRATVASVLLSLHESGELDNPEQWTFERLAQLPAWCLMDESARAQCQAVCGAIVLAPAMVRWINGASFRAAAECVGSDVLEAVLNEAKDLTVPESQSEDWMPAERLTATLASSDERFDRSIALAILAKAHGISQSPITQGSPSKDLGNH